MILCFLRQFKNAEHSGRAVLRVLLAGMKTQGLPQPVKSFSAQKKRPVFYENTVGMQNQTPLQSIV